MLRPTILSPGHEIPLGLRGPWCPRELRSSGRGAAGAARNPTNKNRRWSPWWVIFSAACCLLSYHVRICWSSRLWRAKSPLMRCEEPMISSMRLVSKGSRYREKKWQVLILMMCIWCFMLVLKLFWNTSFISLPTTANDGSQIFQDVKVKTHERRYRSCRVPDCHPVCRP